ncbi:hypothetical protein [Nesterenkonia natronophila]|uniref:Uncharacterized protein n=1 Tax=Nesterenkonia natronophila TaxID=2174932 RepID=A0A3A4F524_9MICC|nr:hypothetical protein [Nesterenkonia natronophila]RJN32906.1 hypothetical protein D3250_03580 [Nesterenkonia natronophila]
MEEPYVWRQEAQVTYPDWKGTAQLDQRKTTDTLEEVVGLDPDKWIIVGFDIGGFERPESRKMHVVAATREHFSEVRELDDALELQVTDFLIHNVDPFEILQKITHVFEMRMRIRHLPAERIRVVNLKDVPEQPDE